MIELPFSFIHFYVGTWINVTMKELIFETNFSVGFMPLYKNIRIIEYEMV